jgi:hypothetical protein
MITAMQELVEEIKLNQVAAQMFFINEPVKFFDKYLEKEKEQIKKAFEFGVADAYNFIEDEAEQYYNQTYNQNES